MRPSPYIDEDQTPKVHNGQAIRKYRSFRGFWQKVVHDSKERSGQKECDRVVAVPPLHERVLAAGINGVTAVPIRWHGEIVEDVQHGDGNDRGDIKPNRHIQVSLAAYGNGAKEIHREDNPNQDHCDVNWPFKLRVFLALGKSKRQADGGGHNDELPTPEMNIA